MREGEREQEQGKRGWMGGGGHIHTCTQDVNDERKYALQENTGFHILNVRLVWNGILNMLQLRASHYHQ